MPLLSMPAGTSDTIVCDSTKIKVEVLLCACHLHTVPAGCLIHVCPGLRCTPQSHAAPVTVHRRLCRLPFCGCGSPHAHLVLCSSRHSYICSERRSHICSNQHLHICIYYTHVCVLMIYIYWQGVARPHGGAVNRPLTVGVVAALGCRHSPLLGARLGSGPWIHSPITVMQARDGQVSVTGIRSCWRCRQKETPQAAAHGHFEKKQEGVSLGSPQESLK